MGTSLWIVPRLEPFEASRIFERYGLMIVGRRRVLGIRVVVKLEALWKFPGLELRLALAGCKTGTDRRAGRRHSIDAFHRWRSTGRFESFDTTNDVRFDDVCRFELRFTYTSKAAQKSANETSAKRADLHKFDDNCGSDHNRRQRDMDLFLVHTQKAHENNLCKNETIQRVPHQSDEDMSTIPFVALGVNVNELENMSASAPEETCLSNLISDHD